MKKIAIAIGLFYWLQSPAQEGTDLGVHVTEDAFCIAKTQLNCDEFRFNGDEIRMGELPLDENGNRLIYFHSAQSAQPGASFVHVWQTEDDARRGQLAKVYVSDSARILGGEVLTTLQSFLERVDIGGGFAVVIRNPAPSTAPHYRAYSERVVHGPGEYTAYVGTIRGEIIMESQRSAVTIVE